MTILLAIVMFLLPVGVEYIQGGEDNTTVTVQKAEFKQSAPITIQGSGVQVQGSGYRVQ